MKQKPGDYIETTFVQSSLTDEYLVAPKLDSFLSDDAPCHLFRLVVRMPNHSLGLGQGLDAVS